MLKKREGGTGKYHEGGKTSHRCIVVNERRKDWKAFSNCTKKGTQGGVESSESRLTGILSNT